MTQQGHAFYLLKIKTELTFDLKSIVGGVQKLNYEKMC